MLVVTRRDGESVRIGPDIEVKVWHSPEGQIRVGITAPRDLPIARKELGEPSHLKREETRRG
jgi:carbon storage regulator